MIISGEGETLLIFDKIKLARTDETIAFIDYGERLAALLERGKLITGYSSIVIII